MTIDNNTPSPERQREERLTPLHEQLYFEVPVEEAERFIESPAYGLDFPRMTLRRVDIGEDIYRSYAPSRFNGGEEYTWDKRGLHTAGELALSDVVVRVDVSVKLPGRMSRALSTILRQEPHARVSGQVLPLKKSSVTQEN